MKKFWILAAVALLALVQAQAEIKFLRGPLSDALARAQTEKKPVMIDFITDWCRWCDTLDARTYSDAAVAGYINEAVVPIKIDAEKGEGIAIAKKYGVRAFPTILLINADGEEIDRLLGYMPPEPFLNSVRDYVTGVNSLAQVRAAVEKNPGDPAVQYAAAAKYVSRNEPAQALGHFRKLLELDPENTLGHNEDAEYAVAVGSFQADKKGAPLEAFAAKYPASSNARKALGTLVSVSLRGEDGDGAKKYFLQYAARYPDDAIMMNNYAWTCAEKKINLDHAAETARAAVALARTDGERAMYLDTQATVEFGRGNIKEAITLEEHALGMLKHAPAKERKEYEETLAKFKAAGK
jgi:thioredoxin-related protein